MAKENVMKKILIILGIIVLLAMVFMAALEHALDDAAREHVTRILVNVELS